MAEDSRYHAGSGAAGPGARRGGSLLDRHARWTDRAPQSATASASDAAADGPDDGDAIRAALDRIRQRLLAEAERQDAAAERSLEWVSEDVVVDRANDDVDEIDLMTMDRPDEPHVGEGAVEPLPPEASPAVAPPRRPRGRVPLLVAGAATGAAIGLAAAFAWPLSYVASAEIAIDPGSRAAESALTDNAGHALVESHMRLVRSSTVLGEAVETLELDRDAEFNGGASWLPGLAHIFGDAAQTRDRAELELRARQTLSQRLVLERAGNAYGFSIRISTADPHKSARVANGVAAVLVADEARAANGTGVSLAGLDDLRARLDDAEAALARAQVGQDARASDGGGDVVRLAGELETMRERARALAEQADAFARADADGVIAGTLPGLADLSSLVELRGRHAGLRQEMDRLAVRLGPRHPERLALDAQLQAARADITREIQRQRIIIGNELERVERRQGELAQRMTAQNAGSGEPQDGGLRLASLERDAQTARAAYEDVRRRLENGEGNAQSAPAIRIISPAEPPQSSQGLSAIAGGLLGGAGGFLAALGIWLAWRREPAIADAHDLADDPSVAIDPHDGDEGHDRAGSEHMDVRSAEEAGSTPAPHPVRHDDMRAPVEPMDPQTEAVIDEIRTSLREFRDALREFADRRDNSRDYGT